MKKTLTVFAIVLLVSCSLFAITSACDEHNQALTLSPPQGFAVTTISGTGFAESKTVSIEYDGVVQSTIPAVVKTDSKGSFTAIISIPNELAVGGHTITATDQYGCSASSTFTVVDMKGPQGVQGISGQSGKDGINGLNGINGQDGINGVNGKDGVNGLNGLNGIDGVIGTNGTDGKDGINGINGINGTDGVSGNDGKDGANGLNGINGKNGINGVNGKDGTNGTNGAQGLPGSQGATELIITKPTPVSGTDLWGFITILAFALVAFTAVLITVYRKSHR
jgi:hypothetical protein